MTPASTSVPIAVKRIGNSSAGVLRGHGRKMQRRYRGIFSASMSRTKQERNWPCRLRKSPPACGRRRNPRGWQSAPARRDAQVDIPALCPHRKIPRLLSVDFYFTLWLTQNGRAKTGSKAVFSYSLPGTERPRCRRGGRHQAEGSARRCAGPAGTGRPETPAGRTAEGRPGVRQGIGRASALQHGAQGGRGQGRRGPGPVQPGGPALRAGAERPRQERGAPYGKRLCGRAILLPFAPGRGPWP